MSGCNTCCTRIVQVPASNFQITGIDFAPTGNPEEYTVSVSWIDANGVPQATTDATPVTIPHPAGEFGYCPAALGAVTSVGGASGFVQIAETFTPHADGDYTFTFTADTFDNASTNGGIIVGTTAGGNDVFVTGGGSPPRISAANPESSVTLALEGGVEYFFTAFAGGAGNDTHTGFKVTGAPAGLVCLIEDAAGNAVDNASFIVNAGTTPAVADDANGTATVVNGSTLHFWSSDGSVQFDVVDGSAIVDITAATTAAQISVEEGNLLITGDDGNMYAMPLVAETCYSVEIPATGPFNQTITFDTQSEPQIGTETVVANNAGGGFTLPGIQALIDQMGVLPEWRLTSALVAIFAGNQGNTTLINTTQGVSTASVLVTGSSQVMTFPGHQVQPTDVFQWGGIVATNRSVGLQNTSNAAQNVGDPSQGPRISFDLAYRTGTIETRTVRTYSDGETTKLIEIQGGDPVELASIPANYTEVSHTVCVDHISTDAGNRLRLGSDDRLYAGNVVNETCYREVVDAPLAGSEFDLTNFDGTPSASAGLTLGTSQMFFNPMRQVFFDTNVLPFGARLKQIRMHDVRRGNNTQPVGLSYNGVGMVVSPAGGPALHANGLSPAPVSFTLATSELIDAAIPVIEANTAQNHLEVGAGLGEDFIASITPGVATASGGANDGVTSQITGFNAAFTFELSQINHYTVREYDDGTFVAVDQNGAVTFLSAIPAAWELLDHTVCVDHISTEVGNTLILGDDSLLYGMPLVSSECWQEPGTTFEFTTEPAQTENNGNMLQASGAVAPSGALVRITAGAVPVQINSVRVRAGANGFTTTGTMVLGGVTYTRDTAVDPDEDISGIYRTLVFTPATTPLQLAAGQSVTSSGNWGAMTGGFQGPVSSAAGPTPPFGTLTQARAEVDFTLGTVIPGMVHIVNTYTDGETTKIVEVVNGEPTELPEIPAAWTLCPSVFDLDTRITTLETSPIATFTGGVRSDVSGTGTAELTDDGGPNGTANEVTKINTGTVAISGGVGTVNFTEPFGNTGYRFTISGPGNAQIVIGRTAASIDVTGDVDGTYEYIAIGVAP